MFAFAFVEMVRRTYEPHKIKENLCDSFEKFCFSKVEQHRRLEITIRT